MTLFGLLLLHSKYLFSVPIKRLQATQPYFSPVHYFIPTSLHNFKPDFTAKVLPIKLTKLTIGAIQTFFVLFQFLCWTFFVIFFSMMLRNGRLLTGKALSLYHVSNEKNMGHIFGDFDEPVWNTSEYFLTSSEISHYNRGVLYLWTATLCHHEEQQQTGEMCFFICITFVNFNK